MQDDYNPFKTPVAVVADQAQGHSGFMPEGRRVPIGSGLNWLGTGWRFFKESPGVWIGTTLILGVITFVMSFIPLVNFFVSFIFPIFTGGIMLGCKAMDDGEALSINHLFAGFSGYAGRLFLIGLLNLVYIFVVMMLAGILMAIAVPLYQSSGMLVMIFFILIGFVFFLLVVFPMFIFTWFAPTLIVLQDQSPVQAMVSSFKIVFINILPFLIYMLILFVLSIIATIPLLLGLLVFLPVVFGSIYAAYCDIFFEASA